MIVSIDYDKTFTAAPELFKQLIHLFQKNDHTVICVTGRHETMSDDGLRDLALLIPVIYAGGEWKKIAAQQHGYVVDIWIDDDPVNVAEQFLIRN